MKLSRSNTPNNMLDKKAAKMVEEVRLQTIQKEYKSSGALLDTRQLHRLDAVETNAGREKAQSKMETQKRVDSRRGGRSHKEITQDAKKTIDTMMQKGQAIVKTSNFENEELIWATKSADPNYSKKRKYDDPELHRFRLEMDMEQRKVYKVLCHDALVNLATNLREEMNTMKADMDLAGIFHPDANAHRAHCMYLMKLYNHIRAETIEDPVLRKMKSDIEERERAIRDEEKKQRELILSIERKNRKVPETEKERLQREAEEREKEERERELPLATKTATKRRSKRPALSAGPVGMAEEGKARRARAIANSERNALRKSASSKTLPGHGPGPLPSTILTTAAVSGDLGEENGGSVGDEEGDSVLSMTESSVTSNTSGMGGDGNGTFRDGAMTNADQKMFAKMKRSKMGKVDPTTLLVEETKALEEAEVREHQKKKERSTLVDASMGKWIMGLLQTSQISKTSEGSVNAPVPDGPGLLPTTSLNNPSIDSPTKLFQARGNGEYDPQQTVPFKDFYEMFKTYSDEQQKEKEEAARRAEEEMLEAQRRAQEEEEEAAAAAAAEALAALDAELKERELCEDEGKAEENEPESAEEEGKAEEKASSTPAKAGTPPAAPAPAPAKANVYATATSHVIEAAMYSDQEETIWKPSNTIADLEESDPAFQAYMKMMRRQNPQGQKLFRGKSTKKTKAKPHNPLGQKAVTMVDSKGKDTADASKGFKNIFQEAHADSDSSDDDDYFDDETHASTHNDDSTVGAADGQLDSPDKTTTTPTGIATNIATIDASAKITQQSVVSRPSSTPKRGGRPSSRGRAKRTVAGAADNANKGEEPPSLQKKLTITFDCLQTPALTRLSFMRRFATAGRASQFAKAVDVLSEAAVVVMARQHIVQRTYLALKDGFAVMPLIADRLLSTFYEVVPRVFASRDPALCSQATSTAPMVDPASSLAFASIESIVHQLFPNDRVNDAKDNMMTPESAKELLTELEYAVDVMLDEVQAGAVEALHEPIEIGGVSIQNWRKKLKDIIDPPPPKEEPKKEEEGKEGGGESKDAKK